MSGSDEDWVVDINGWDLKVSLAEELERSMADLTEHLYHYLYEVEETEEGPEWLPPSGYPYCGCTTCDVREALVVLVPWGLWLFVARAAVRQGGWVAVCLLLLVGVGWAVDRGLPLPWALPLLSVGPVALIAFNEAGRRRHVACFEMR